MRKFIIFLIILTMIGTVTLVAVNLINRKTDDSKNTTEQSIDLSGLDNSQASGTSAITPANAPASQTDSSIVPETK